MAAIVYLADPWNTQVPDSQHPRIVLESDAAYWYVYRHSEAANLDRTNKLVYLYCGAIIEGYQLHRLPKELLEIENKPESWKVLIGWNS